MLAILSLACTLLSADRAYPPTARLTASSLVRAYTVVLTIDLCRNAACTSSRSLVCRYSLIANEWRSECGAMCR